MPDPADVRAEMHAALAQLEAADHIPWPDRELRVWRIVWPQMMNWLPEAEHAELQRRFDDELCRLQSRAA